MKNITKILFGFAAVLFFSINTVSAQSDNENSLIGRAHGAAAQCLSDAHMPGYEINAQIETNAICFAGGFLQTVTFYQSPACHGNPSDPCPRPATRIVAEVTFGCEGEVISVTCY
jgi:hypothetical protein